MSEYTIKQELEFELDRVALQTYARAEVEKLKYCVGCIDDYYHIAIEQTKELEKAKAQIEYLKDELLKRLEKEIKKEPRKSERPNNLFNPKDQTGLLFEI